MAGWGSGAAIQEVFGIPPMLLNDDRLGRVLEDFAPVAESVRGAVMLRAIETFGLDASRLHLDLTATAGGRRLRELGAGGQGVGRRSAGGPPGAGPGGDQPSRRADLCALPNGAARRNCPASAPPSKCWLPPCPPD